MKITVCFGDTKIIVPCGDGNIKVKDIIENAFMRFKKATNNNNNNNSSNNELNVSFIKLKTKRDDGLLDPDDILKDVVEDKEILIAIYENILNSHDDTDCDSHDSLNYQRQNQLNEVLVTQNHLTDKNISLKVKSESLNNLIDRQQQQQQGMQASITLDKRPSLNNHQNRRPDSARSTFSRSSSNRQSKLLQNDNFTNQRLNIPPQQQQQQQNTIETFLFQLQNTPGVLGIHVIPTYDINSQRDMGLIIQRIEPNGRIYKDGRLKVGDRIVDINDHSLIGVDFVACQQLLRNALQDEYLSLRIIRDIDSPLLYQNNQQQEQEMEQEEREIEIKVCSMQDEEQTSDKENNQLNTFETQKQNNQTLNDRLLVSPSYYTNNSKFNLNSLNTKKIGKKISVHLVKGPQGLGFKLAARDNPTGEISPIYIKNILPRGAAITDGRLQRGDRLLSVNNIDMTVKTLHEAVGILRETKLGSTVEIVVSRQVTSLPRELPPDDQENNQNIEPDINLQRELLTFEIALNDTGSAGLGVSVKGKTKRIEENESTVDLGIFVKTVINGGAASKDGRLKPNDQLININGFSLLGKSNEEAMQILREAMQVEIKPGFIQLTVSRKIKNKELQLQQKSQQILQQGDDDEEEMPSNQKNCYVSNEYLNSNYAISDSPDYCTNYDNTEESNYYSKRAFNRDAPTRRSMSEKRKMYSSQRDHEFFHRMKMNKSFENQSTDFKRTGSFESVVGRSQLKNQEPINNVSQQASILNRRFTQVSRDANEKTDEQSNDEKRSVDELRRNYIKMIEAQNNFTKSKPPLNGNQPTTVQIKQHFSNETAKKLTSSDTLGNIKNSSNSNKFLTIGGSFRNDRYNENEFINNNQNTNSNQAPLSNILNRQRTINRSFRTAVDKSFDVPISSEVSEDLNGRLSAAGLSDGSRAHHLRMSSQSEDSRKSKKSKKSFMETFQNLFKTTKREHKPSVELLNYNKNDILNGINNQSKQQEALNNNQNWTNDQEQRNFVPNNFQRMKSLSQTNGETATSFYAKTILNSSTRNNSTKNRVDEFNIKNMYSNEDLFNLPKPAQV